MGIGSANSQWEEIERTLGAALALPEDQRAAYLAGQPAAIRAEVESLLAAHDRAGNFLGGDTHISGLRAVGAGTQLGPYRIESLIGEGGMGAVYRALDTKLNRSVAVKFLFDDLADPAARRRFQREAQTASSLNHPHILTVHDTGEFDGRQYLVTEFIDGGTLKEWARAQKRTWREIVGLLAGVADGLATAHAAGILHRDIKPDNILVGTNGYAKLSDFGLAKLQEKTSNAEVTRTLETKQTRPGTILGTIAYMSPEQASGRPTDARGDIFSFGIVLYELLAGHRPFDAATDLELLQTIIHAAPQPLGPSVPLELRLIVDKSLEKDPAERYQSTRDLAVDLRRLTRQASVTTSPAPAAAPTRRLGKIAGLVAAVLLIAAGAVFLLQRPAAHIALQAVQFDLPAPPGIVFTPPIMRRPFAVSPDGARFAFLASGADGNHIWVRDLASLEMHEVPTTDGAESLFWAPDSHSVYYPVKRQLKQANLETGSGRTIAELPERVQLGTWRSPSDLFLFLGWHLHYYEVLVETGALHEAPVGDNERGPQFLPGGKRYIYIELDPITRRERTMVSEYPLSKTVPLMETDSLVQYAPPRRPDESGYLLFIRAGILLAQAFDADRSRLSGEPFPIARNVIYYASSNSPSFSVSENGVLVYQAGFPVTELKWFDRQGKPVGAVGRPSPYWGTLRLSPDGRRVAAIVYNPENGGNDTWTFDSDGRESHRLTFPPEIARRPVFSPDGKRLVIGKSISSGAMDLAIVELDGSGKDEPVPHTGKNGPTIPTDWSRDGRFIAFDSAIPEDSPDGWVADLHAKQYVPILQNAKFTEWGIAFSPDVKQIAFVSSESGRPEVYLQEFVADPVPHVTGDRRQVSRDGACLVRWRADGRELFYLGNDNRMFAVPVKGVLQFGEPQSLFQVPGAPHFETTRDFQFDVSPDGQRFLMTTSGSVPPPPFTVIQNWQEKFRR